jgi:hypothetical protein
LPFSVHDNVDHPVSLYAATMAATFQDIEKTGEIGIEICVRIFQRVTNAGLRREMHDRYDLVLALAPYTELEEANTR